MRIFHCRTLFARLIVVLRCSGENVLAGFFTVRIYAVELFGMRSLLSNVSLSHVLSSQFQVVFIFNRHTFE